MTTIGKLQSEFVRISQMINALTVNFPLVAMEPEVLAQIETGYVTGDSVLCEAYRSLLRDFQSIKQPEAYQAISQLYEDYAEAAVYLLLTQRGALVERTEGTGQDKQKRPDFKCTHAGAEFYVEVKTLDVQDGWIRHKEVAQDGLQSRADLDARVRSATEQKATEDDGHGSPTVNWGAPVSMSPFNRGIALSQRIDLVIKKIKTNVKREQLSLGPTLLVVHLGRVDITNSHPSSLLPVYFDRLHDEACASGELWHVALGRIGNAIYAPPEFAGRPNLAGELTQTGVLIEYPELLGTAFVFTVSGTDRIYTIQNLGALDQSKAGKDIELVFALQRLSDALNSSHNEAAHRYQVRW